MTSSGSAPSVSTPGASTSASIIGEDGDGDYSSNSRAQSAQRDTKPRRHRSQRQSRSASSSSSRRHASSSALSAPTARLGERRDEFLEAQRLLSSMALSRPTPYGAIPPRAHHAKRQMSEPTDDADLRLSPTDAFEYQPNLDMSVTRGITTASYDAKGKGKGPSPERLSSSPSQASMTQSPTSPVEDWEQCSSDSPVEGGRSIRIAREPLRRGSAGMSTSRSRESTGPASADTTPCSSRSSSLPRKPSLLRQNLSPPLVAPVTAPALVTATSLSAAHTHKPVLLDLVTAMDDDRSRSAIRNHVKGLDEPDLESASGKAPGNARNSHIKAHMISTSTDSAQAASNAALPSLYTLSRGRSAHVSPSRRWDRRGASASVLCTSPLQLDLQDNPDDFDEDEATLHEDVGKHAFALERNSSDSTARRRTFLHPSAAEQMSRSSEAEEHVPHLDTALFGSDDDDDMLDSDVSDEEGSAIGSVGRNAGSERSASRAASRAASEGRDLTSSLASSRRSSIDPDRRRELKVLLDRDGPPKGRRASSSTTSSSHGMAVGSLTLSMTHTSSEADRHDDADLSKSAQSSTSMASQALSSLFRRRSLKSPSLSAPQIKHLSPPKLEAIAAGDTPREGLTPSGDSHIAVLSPTHELTNDDAKLSERKPLREKASLSMLKDAANDPLLGTGSVDDSIEVEAVEWADERRRSDADQQGSLVVGSPSSADSRKLTAAEQEDQRKKGFAAAYQQRLYNLSSRFWSPARNLKTDADDAQVRDEISAEIGSVAAAPAAPASSSGLLASGWRHLAGLPNLLLMPTLGYTSSVRRDSKAESIEADDESAAVASEPVDETMQGAQKSEALLAAQVAVAQLTTAPHRLPSGIASTAALSSASSEAVGRALASAHSLHSTSEADEGKTAVDDEMLPEKHASPRSLSRAPSTTSQTPESKPAQDLPQQLQPISLAKRSRGVLTPQEADADISAYVAGLGLPIDPDVELSSVVHLQTFRINPEAHDANPAIRLQRAESKAPLPQGSQPVSRKPSHEAKARVDEGEAARSTVKEEKMAQRDVRKEEPAQVHDRRSSPRERSRTDGGVVLQSKCSRPAVDAPVPRNFSAYNSEESSEESIAEDEQRGRRRPRQHRRPSPPPKQQQCAVGLFASSPYTRERTGGGRSGRSGRTSGTGHRSNRSSRQTSPEGDSSATLLRIRSTPNLTNLVPAGADAKVFARNQRSRETSESGEDSEQPDERSTRRGRAGGVKRVSLSRGGVKHEQGQALPNAANGAFPSSIMAGSAATAAAAAASLDGAPGVGDIQQLSPDMPAGAMNAANGKGPLPPSPSSAPAPRLPPIVGASGMPNFAGRPSMVSNGAHLLMLSLELEMMRNSKITGSLKPRWLKARMRTEPYGPAAIIASVARERQMQQQRQQRQAMAGTVGADACALNEACLPPPEETSPDVEMTCNMSPLELAKSRALKPFVATRPKRGSGLRFEIEASSSDGHDI